MKRRKRRHSLTLLLGSMIFVILVASCVLAIAVVYVLSLLGWMPSLDESASSVLRLLLYMGLISLVLGGILSFLAARIPMKSATRAIDTINRLAKGEFSARMSFEDPIQSHPAIREMTESFNLMAQELEQTELLRSDFVNNFSHEFKTPIVSIAGFAKLLRRGNLTQAQKEEYLAIIEEESLRLADMATNMMYLSKVENQTILTDRTRFNLSEQLRSCVLLLESKWSGKNLMPDLEFGEYPITANEELLKQVWINLLDNAIKFSPNQGELPVRIQPEAGQLAVSITNYGVEIPEDKQDKIWNKFYQGDESHASHGNGIGLAVVKRIVQLHGGSVAVFSRDGITTFTVKLPEQ